MTKQSPHTLGHLLHVVANALSLISSHAQYLAGKPDSPLRGQQLHIICHEAERAATLLALVPDDLRTKPVEGIFSATPTEDQGSVGGIDDGNGTGRD